MFTMYMPLTFRIGDRADVRINDQPATLWWRDAETLVINETDVRTICIRRPTHDSLQVFYCSDADGTMYYIGEETLDGFVVCPVTLGDDE